MPPHTIHPDFRSFDGRQDLLSIDALRGYAIMWVILAHTLVHVPELPWPLKRFFMMGVYGVQLFFLASALTLMMSWTRSEDSFLIRCKKFYTNRILRIAPLYYLAIPYYYFLNSYELVKFDYRTLLATLFFYNSWFLEFTFPYNLWAPVPGGWSISVEFTFYLFFPLIALLVKNINRAVIFFAITLIFMIGVAQYGKIINPLGKNDLISIFLYYLPLNQFFAFSLGIILYFLVKKTNLKLKLLKTKITADKASLILLSLVAVLSFYPAKKTFDPSNFLPPTHLIISLAFLAWSLVLILNPSGKTVGKPVVRIGKLSFSVYILHFSVLSTVDISLRKFFVAEPQGILAVGYWFLLTVISTACSVVAANATYKYIEKPFILFGKSLGQTNRKNKYEFIAKSDIT